MEEATNFAPAIVAIPGYLVGTWKADPLHSEIAFSVRHLMVSKVRGRFTSYEVTIVTSEDPRGSSVAATIDLASIDTGNEPRDNHLRSADYFEVEKYPTMSYRSTGIRPTDDGWVIDGELTLHGVTRQVPLTGEVNGFGPDLTGQRPSTSPSKPVTWPRSRRPAITTAAPPQGDTPGVPLVRLAQASAGTLPPAVPTSGW
jgi:polyisoprenoid-binding protein YceI